MEKPVLVTNGYRKGKVKPSQERVRKGSKRGKLGLSKHPWHPSQLKALPSSWQNKHPLVDCKGCVKTAAHGVPKELYDSQGSPVLAVATGSFVTEAVRSAANEAANCRKVKNGLMAKILNDHINTLQNSHMGTPLLFKVSAWESEFLYGNTECL